MSTPTTMIKVSRILALAVAISAMGACETQPDADTAPPGPSPGSASTGFFTDTGGSEIGCRNTTECLVVAEWARIGQLQIGSRGLSLAAPLVLCGKSTCPEAMLWEFDDSDHRLYLRSGRNGAINPQPVLVIEQHMSENAPARVGIGVPSNHNITHELEVNGTILAEEIEVVAAVADYVFDDNFHLISLDKVEAFIANNHHLPGIPSKSEVAQQGGKVPLGQAFTQMLQKIEELTLYTIEQHKTLNEQQKLLKAQRDEMQAIQGEIGSLRKMLLSNAN